MTAATGNTNHNANIDLFPNDWVVINGLGRGAVMYDGPWGWKVCSPYEAPGFETVAQAEAEIARRDKHVTNDIERRHVLINAVRRAVETETKRRDALIKRGEAA